MTELERETEGGKVVLLLLAGLVLIFGGAYVAAVLVAGDNVPLGTTVAGVEVGGQSREAAVDALEEGLADRARAPIPVAVDGESRKVRPAEAGLSVDYAASVSAAGGEMSWDPVRLWDYYTGGEDLDAVLTVDEDRLSQTVDGLVQSAGRLPRDGDVSFDGSRIVVTRPVLGSQISVEEATADLLDAYLQDDATVELKLRPAQPEVDEADVQEAVDSFANRAVAGPVVLRFDKTPVYLEPRRFGRVLAMRPEDGELVPALREKKLLALVDSAISTNGAPVPATVRVVDGQPEVVPDRPGVGYEPDDVTSTFLDVVTRPAGKREVKVPATVERAEFRTKDARELQIVERVSTFTTYFPHADYRNINIGRAAELVDGTVLKPGETFSLNETVGERTRANGFTEGFIISDGVYKEDLGGGVSQMATTTFNAMFFAGLEDVEHKTHSFYIDRYPVGREATVAWGSVDLRFRNDTPYGVLITASVTPSTASSSGVVTVSMWSTKVWDITAVTSDRYNFREEKTRVIRSDDCVPNDGYAGFDVDVTRVFRRAGERQVDHREVFHTSYIPSDTVVCR